MGRVLAARLDVAAPVAPDELWGRRCLRSARRRNVCAKHVSVGGLCMS